MLRGVRLVATLLLAALAVAACSTGGPVDGSTDRAVVPTDAAPDPVTCRDAPTGPETVPYASRPDTDPNLTSLDVYLPAGCSPVPAVVWVHGGRWRRGDKALGSVEGKVRLADELGAALVSVNYRLSAEGTDVRWPDHGDDLATALGWIRTDGPTLGIDPTRMALIGHSAGGHLVAVAGADAALLTANGADPESIGCVVVLDSAAVTLSAGNPLHAAAFGTDPEVLAGASPLTLVERNGPPTAEVLVVAQGGPIRLATQRAFVDAITTAGGAATFVDANPYDHNGVSAAVGDADDGIVTPAVRDLLSRCLAP